MATLTGVRRSPNRVRLFLTPSGVQCRQVGLMPATAEVDVQAPFNTTALEPRREAATAGTRAVFLVDAVHFVLAPF